MFKKEIIWREILFQFFENRVYRFTQKELANKFSFSLSTVSNALKIPRASGAIEVRERFFQVCDAEKFLNIWATFRRLDKDIIYKVHVELSPQEIESNMPPDVIYTAYSAYHLKFNEAPADYDRVYVYVNDLEKIKKRFSPKKGYENLIVLKADKFLFNYGPLPPLAQIYVDIWNLKEWYAKDFLMALKEKMIR